MRSIVRWLLRGLLGVVLLLIVAGAVIYLVSERILRQTYTVPPVDIAVPRDSQSVIEGHRLARIRGCSGDCHGMEIEGGVFIDHVLVARLVAPNLTAAVRKYPNAELVRIIRQGVRPDGSSVIGMPSEMFSGLTDEDLGKILAYLLSKPLVPGAPPDRRLGPVARIAFVAGKLQPAAELVRKAAAVPSGTYSDADSNAAGGYLAKTSCTECHGLDLCGGGGGGAPDLRVAAGYSLEAFTGLMRRGTALGNRELPLMSQVARTRFSHFTDPELRNLYSFLIARARRPCSSESGT